MLKQTNFAQTNLKILKSVLKCQPQLTVSFAFSLPIALNSGLDWWSAVISAAPTGRKQFL